MASLGPRAPPQPLLFCFGRSSTGSCSAARATGGAVPGEANVDRRRRPRLQARAAVAEGRFKMPIRPRDAV
jgi:hypothetical protein